MATFIEVKGKKQTKYKAIIRIKGYRTKCKAFSKISDAKKWAKNIEAQMEAGEYKDSRLKSVTGNISIDTIKDLIDYFKENEATDRYSYSEKYSVMYDWWSNKIGHLRYSELNQSILSECKLLLGEEEIEKPLKGNKYRSNSTINKYLYAFSAVINYGIEEFALWEYNPMHKIGKKKKNKAVKLRARFLSEEEISLLKQAAREKSYIFYVFVLIALNTGARYSEILHLKVENIDMKNLRIHYLNTKNETNRGVPITKKLMYKVKTLLKIRNINQGYIFLNDSKEHFIYMKGIFEKLIKELKIEDFRFHDLRHTSASYFLMSGATENDLMDLFGWTSHAMVRRYAHLSRKHTESLVEKTSKLFL